MKTWTLEIDGMSCGGCVAGVRKALGRVQGAEVVEAEVGRATVRAEGDVAAAIRGAVEAAGFELRALHERA
ncbi:MAG: heavy-metal-associated domain-containing protein [Polyangiales bacterium]